MEIITRENAEGENEYFLMDADQQKETDVRLLIFEEIVNDCQWLDEENRFILVEYYDWDNNELLAIVNANGELIRKGISEVIEFVTEHGMFIIMQIGDNLGEERFDYMAEEEDHVYGVINLNGDYIIDPQPEPIEYNDYEGVFELGKGDEAVKIDLVGKPAED